MMGKLKAVRWGGGGKRRGGEGGKGGGVGWDGEKRRKGERNVEVYKLSCNARPGSGKTKNPNKNPNSLFVASLCCFDFFFWLDLGNLPWKEVMKETRGKKIMMRKKEKKRQAKKERKKDWMEATESEIRQEGGKGKADRTSLMNDRQTGERRLQSLRQQDRSLSLRKRRLSRLSNDVMTIRLIWLSFTSWSCKECSFCPFHC